MTHEPTTPDRMDAGELQTVREYLGLTTEAIAGMLNVRHDTYRRWESGREPIPERVRQEVEDVEEYTARAVDDVVQALMDAPEPAVRVYRTDAGLHRARPDLSHLPARWWRHVAYRAADFVPGVAIVSGLGPWAQAIDGSYAAEGEDGTYRLERRAAGWHAISPGDGPDSGDDRELADAQRAAEQLHRRNIAARARA